MTSNRRSSRFHACFALVDHKTREDRYSFCLECPCASGDLLLTRVTKKYRDLKARMPKKYGNLDLVVVRCINLTALHAQKKDPGNEV